MAMNAPAPVTSLYVTDLDLEVNEGQLYEMFSAIGPVASIRVCRDSVTRRSLGYGYVNYNSAVDESAASRAIEELNYTEVNGKIMRVMMSERDPTKRKNGASNVFIKNLEESIDQKALHDTLAPFGKILSCKVPLHLDGKSRGYGFVHFDTEEAALLVIEKVNGMLINGKKVYVGKHVRKGDREVSDSPVFTNVYVKNLDLEVTEEELMAKFGEVGAVTTVKIMKDAEGKSLGFGFVNFEDPACASRAVEVLNGTELGSMSIFCGRAMKKHERAELLRREFEERQRAQAEKYQGANLYVKNLDDSIDDEKLKQEFSAYGSITSAKVMMEGRISRGFGFVCFSSPEEAASAIAGANGRLVCGKPLFVSFAQKKEERKQQLLQMYSGYGLPANGAMQARMLPAVPSHMPPGMYVNPTTGAPMFYAPAHAGVLAAMPQQQHYQQQQQQQQQQTQQQQQQGGGAPTGQGMVMFQQQWRPGGQFQGGVQQFVPQNVRGQRVNQQRGGISHQQNSSAGMLHHPQISVRDVPRNQHQNRHQPQGQQSQPGIRYNGPPAMNGGPMMLPPQHRVPQGISSLPLPSGGGAQQQFPAMMGDALNPAILASVPPSEQKQMIGERLFPMVNRQQPDLAGKITGMLLEMDNTELLLLLESPSALSEKVEEAVGVLQQHGGDVIN